MAYGVTLTGFIIKDLQTIKTELETDFKNTYGNDLDVSEDSASGQLIGNLSKKFANIWELAQAVYNSMNPDKAEGVSLDGASALTGNVRLPSTSSSVTVALYGTIGTIIPLGHIVQQTETLENFELTTPVTISLSSIIDCTISVLNVLNTTSYTITINGNTYTYTSDGDATDLEIIAGLKTDIETGSEPIIITDNLDGTMNIVSDNGFTSFSISIDVNLQIDEQASPGVYTAINTGSISVPSNTIQTIVNPISGLDTINNIAAGLTGRDKEKDEEFRIRRRSELTAIGAGTDEAIKAALLQEVDNVSAVIVVSNRTDSIDVDGRPPHSFEVVISGGNDSDIADKIWSVMPSGIEPYGSETEIIIDSSGNNQTIKFSRPTNIYIWADIDYQLNNEEIFPSNGENLIKEEIVDWASSNLNIGDDVFYQKLSIPIYSVPGVGTILITLATSLSSGGPPGAYTEDNIVIASNQVAVFNTSRITLNQV